MDRDCAFSLTDVVSKGFEATCVGKDGALYFWHGSFGVRVEQRSGKATLLTDPADLPDAPWNATSTGAKELEAEAASGPKGELGETA